VLTLLELLQSGGTRTVAELASRLGVEPRTVRRYVDPYRHHVILRIQRAPATSCAASSGTRDAPLYAVLLHVSGPDLFHRAMLPLTRRLLVRHWLVATLGELRIIGRQPRLTFKLNASPKDVPQWQPGARADRQPLRRARVRAVVGGGLSRGRLARSLHLTQFDVPCRS
jgi:hypothetical protein